MKKVIVSSIVGLGAVLAGCDRAPEVPVAAGDPCESLEPLLAALPKGDKLAGARAVFRGCAVDDALVYAAYAGEGGKPTYTYTIGVIDENSPYVAAFRNKPQNMKDGVDAFAEHVKSHRIEAEARREACLDAFRTPSTEARPMIYNLERMQVCIQGRKTDSARKLQVTGMKDGLTFALVVGSDEAERASNQVEALRAVEDLFQKFNTEAVR